MNNFKKRAVTFLATGAYAGYSPVAPGTFGTLWGAALAWSISGLSIYTQGFVIIAVFGVSVYLSEAAKGIFGGKDPQKIVIDEVAGFLVSMYLLPFTPLNVILVFLLFRFFDIVKPYPASFFDREVDSGLGIVLDDVAAGVYANISARVIIIWLIK